MKLKKILPLILSLGLLTGCANGGSKGNEDIVTEIKEPVEITFWHAMNGDQEKSLQKLTEKFTSENPNIKACKLNIHFQKS